MMRSVISMGLCLCLLPTAVPSVAVDGVGYKKMALPAGFTTQALIPSSYTSRQTDTPVAVYLSRVLTAVSRRESLEKIAAGFLSALNGFAAPLSPEQRYAQVLKERDMLKKIEELRAIQREPSLTPTLRYHVLNSLWRLEYLVGDVACIPSLESWIALQPVLPDGTVMMVDELINLHIWKKQWSEAHRVLAKWAHRMHKAEQERVTQLLLLAEGRYKDYLARENVYVTAAFRNKMRLLVEEWDKTGSPYLPWLMGELNSSSYVANFVGDMHEFANQQNVPVRVFVNFSHARRSALPYVGGLIKAKWNPFYVAFAKKDPKNIEAFIADLNKGFAQLSDGRFSLKLEQVVFSAPQTFLPVTQTDPFLSLAVSPDVQPFVGKGFTFFIGDFMPDVVTDGASTSSIYGGRGLLVLTPFARDVLMRFYEQFTPMSQMKFIAIHETMHGLGMLHRSGPNIDPVLNDLKNIGHQFVSQEEGGHPVDGSRMIMLLPKMITKYTMSVMNRLRLGWISDDVKQPRTLRIGA